MHVVLLLLFMWYDALQAIKMGDNSLYWAQAYLTLALAASFTMASSMSWPQIAKLEYTFKNFIEFNLNFSQQTCLTRRQ